MKIEKFPYGSEDFKRRNPEIFQSGFKESELDSLKIENLGTIKPKLAMLEHRQKYDSEAERKVAERWIPAQNPIDWGYHEFKIILPGGLYTPDFRMIDTEGHFCVIEVKGVIATAKGKLKHKSTRDSRAKFRAARDLWQWAKFIWIEVSNGEFNVS